MAGELATAMCAGSREKYWGELTADEKIERMRSEVKRLKTATEVTKVLVEELLAHEHGARGEVLTRITSELAMRGLGPRERWLGKKDDEVFF